MSPQIWCVRDQYKSYAPVQLENHKDVKSAKNSTKVDAKANTSSSTDAVKPGKDTTKAEKQLEKDAAKADAAKADTKDAVKSGKDTTKAVKQAEKDSVKLKKPKIDTEGGGSAGAGGGGGGGGKTKLPESSSHSPLKKQKVQAETSTFPPHHPGRYVVSAYFPPRS